MSARGRVEEVVGDMGLTTNVVGTVIQSLANAAVERGEVTEEQMLAYLKNDQFSEIDLWDYIGEVIDLLETGALEYAEENAD